MNRLASSWLAAFLAVALPGAATEDAFRPVAPEIVEATPFTLASPLRRPSGESATGGVVVVLRVAPEIILPRQSAMPVLQCGTGLAFPASRGRDSVLVAILLGDVDLGSDLIFFGPPELPSRVSAEDAAARLAAAEAAGLKPAGPDAAARALAAGSAPLFLESFDDLSPFLVALRCRIEPEALAAAGAPCGESR